MDKINVFIVDDHQLVRQGLVSLVSEIHDNIDVVGQAENGEDALNKIRGMNTRPDIALIDINMPKMNGVELATILKKDYAEIKAIALTMESQGAYIRSMLKAGVMGYLLKDCNKEELLEAITTVYDGEPYFAKELRSEILRQLPAIHGKSRSGTELISPREKEVLTLIVNDRSNSEIADELNISIRTVDSHKQNLLSKTGAKSVAGLVVYAIRNGIV